MLDQYALTQDIAPLLKDMIAAGGKDISGENDYRYVTSFQAFFNYVKEKRPSAVANIDSDNPFPGLLPGKKYVHLYGNASSEGEDLLRADFYHGPAGDFAPAITCGGRYHAIKK
jgi:hypothetical protein